MKKLTALLSLVLILTLSLQAQDEQPDVSIETTQFERIEVIRMAPGTDMLKGFKHAIEERDIKNAVILSGIGSVTDYHFHVVSDKNLPPAEEYPKASTPMDLTSVQGYIFNERVHAHITLADENSMVGGHLEPDTKALTFFIITLGILPDDVDISDYDSININE